ncbi:serine protease [Pseudomonas sp. PD9R]|nr:serine protease [Pseudomonas sp. PD9R]
MKPRLIAGLVFTSLLILKGGGAHAAPDRVDWGEGAPNLSPAQQLSNVDGRYAHWQGIGRVMVDGGMTCTGSLIDTRNTEGLAGPAYVLTSGHCTDPQLSNEFIVNQPATGTVTFNFFHDTEQRQKTYAVSAINWSTLRGQDISLVQLSRSLEQLIADGIKPLKIAAHAMMPNNDILIVGAPLNGFVQRMACKQDHQAAILEGPWRWVDQSSNQCLDVINGISGSPVLGRYTNEIVGVLGTTTRGSGQHVCSTGAPCEVAEGKVNKQLDTNYASPAEGLDRCFLEGHFSPREARCPLGPTWSFPLSTDATDYVKVQREANGEIIPWRWDQRLSLNAPFYRYRHTQTLADCESINGYSEVHASKPEGQNQLSRELREGAGLYFLCVIGQQRPTDVPGQWDARNAIVYWRWLMEEPAPLSPVYRADSIGESDYDVRAYPIRPYLDSDQYRYKTGKVQTVDCDKEENYQEVSPSTGVFHVSIAEGQQKVCLKGGDAAGNSGPSVDFLLPP